MSSTVMIRYRTKPEAADENARLVAAVYAALTKTDPGHLRYITYRLADSVTFVHIAQRDAEANPLADLPEFAEFQQNLVGRCVEMPEPSGATVVGSYG
jgi:Antibiotic biosynthesis monooxygenase